MAKRTTKKAVDSIEAQSISADEVGSMDSIMSEEKSPVTETETIVEEPAPVFPEVAVEEVKEIAPITEEPATLAEDIIEEPAAPAIEEVITPAPVVEEVISPVVVEEKVAPAVILNKDITIPVEFWKNSILSFKGFRKIGDIVATLKNSPTAKAVVRTPELVEELKKYVTAEEATRIASK